MLEHFIRRICLTFKFAFFHTSMWKKRNYGTKAVSFRSPLAHKFVDENANALCFETKLRNSFRSSRPIKTWKGIKKHTPTPMSLYSSIMVGGCGVMAPGLSPTISIVEAARPHGWTTSAAVSFVIHRSIGKNQNN